MHRVVRRALQTALLTTVLVADGAAVAHADGPPATRLASTGPATWVAVAATVLVVAGVSLRRAATTRSARRRINDIPTQRQAPPTS